MERRQFLFIGMQALGAVLLSGAAVLNAAEPITYDYLMAALRPKTEGEKKYLKEVVALVNAGDIPPKLVYAAWRVAAKKQKSRRVRYFAETLTILCKRSGVELPIKLVL